MENSKHFECLVHHIVKYILVHHVQYIFIFTPHCSRLLFPTFQARCISNKPTIRTAQLI